MPKIGFSGTFSGRAEAMKVFETRKIAGQQKNGRGELSD